MTEPKILLYDVETAFNIVASFQLRDEYTPHQNILKERYIICACWKWLGDKKIHHISVLDDPKRYAKEPYDDYHVVSTLYDLLASADVLVAHNGDKFDAKFIKTRGLVQGLPALPPLTTIDTYKVAKQNFMFNSNRLDYLGRFLGFGGKKHTPPELWLDVLKGSKDAIKTMVDYNKRDVELLEKVFLKLRPYMSGHINRELFGKTGCPRCGSTHVQSRGTHKAISRVYRRFQCQTCSGWFRSVVNDKAIKTGYRVL